MAEVNEEVLSDAVLTGITEAMKQFADLLDQMSQYAADKKTERGMHPGQELYWGGFVEGLQTAATTARELRPLRGIK